MSRRLTLLPSSPRGGEDDPARSEGGLGGRAVLIVSSCIVLA